MAEIIRKEQLSEDVWRYRINAPRIARKRKAGQFIILRPTTESERIPLTIANGNPEEGWIELIFQKVGLTTAIFAQMNEGDNIHDLAGPLGKPTHVVNYGRCICIGGGVGVAPLYPIVNALKGAGNHITTIIGARTEKLLILEKEMQENSDSLEIATDDGSKGFSGFVTGLFEKLIREGNKFDFAVVIGPPLMMKFTTALTIKAGIKTVASLNPIMVDGTGMCGGCRVTVNSETKFACVDGPEFNADGIDWDELIKRLSSYKKFEKDSVEKHSCRLEEAL